MSSDFFAHQIQTKASNKIPFNSYSFVFITFKDTMSLKGSKMSGNLSSKSRIFGENRKCKQSIYPSRKRTVSEQTTDNKLERKRRRGRSLLDDGIEDDSENYGNLDGIFLKKSKMETDTLKESTEHEAPDCSAGSEKEDQKKPNGNGPLKENNLKELQSNKISHDFTEFCKELNQLIKEASQEEDDETTDLNDSNKVKKENRFEKKSLLSSTVCEDTEEKESKMLAKEEDQDMSKFDIDKEKTDSIVEEQKENSSEVDNCNKEHYPLKKRNLRPTDLDKEQLLKMKPEEQRKIEINPVVEEEESKFDKIERELNEIFRDSDKKASFENENLTDDVNEDKMINHELTEEILEKDENSYKNIHCNCPKKSSLSSGISSDEEEKINTHNIIEDQQKNKEDKNETLVEFNAEKEKPLKVVKIISNELLSPPLQILKIDNKTDHKINNEGLFERKKYDNFTKNSENQFDHEATELTEEKKLNKKQKNITEYFLKRNEISSNDVEKSEEEKSVSSHFSLFNEDQSASINKKKKTKKTKDDSKLRRKLINKVSHKIEKILSQDKQVGFTYGVDVSVKVKKIDSRGGTDEELCVSYKKKSNQNKDVCENYKEDKNEETPLIKEAVVEELGDHNLLDQKPEGTRILDHIKIKTPSWSVPPLHQIDKRVATHPTDEGKVKMKALGLNIKTGNFTKNEDERIRSNFEEFCRNTNLPVDPSPFLNFSHLKGAHFGCEKRVQFVRFLAHGLDERTLFSVYKRFQRLYLKEKIKSGRFTEKEDEIIRKYMESTGSKTPFLHLAKILNRDRMAVLKRYKRLTELDKKEDSMKSRWNQERIEEFLRKLMDVTGLNDVQELKKRNISKEEWKEMSKKMNTSMDNLRQIWFNKIYVRVFIEENLNTDEIKKQIIDLLFNKEQTWNDIDWNEIAKEFKGLTGQYVKNLFKATVKNRVPEEKQNNLKECLEYLKDNEYSNRRRSLTKIDLDESISFTGGSSI